MHSHTGEVCRLVTFACHPPSVAPPLIFLSFHVRLTKNIYFILLHAQNKKNGEFPSEIKGIHHSVTNSLCWALFVTFLSLREGKERE